MVDSNKDWLCIENITKKFGDNIAVDDVTISVPKGAFLALLGPSGCGKTTSLRMLAGLEDPTEGRIVFGERTVVDTESGAFVPGSQRGCGLVFQSYALWPHKTVRQNVSWPLSVAKWGSERITERTNEALAMMDILELAERYPAEISGGQQQRVAIARMIAPEPDVLLFDEPLSNLDAKLRVETRAELMRVHREIGATSVYVTHDQVEAMTMATHIALLRDGQLEQLGTPSELLNSPATPFVARFIGTPPANVFPADLVGGFDGGKLAMYRPESLSVSPRGQHDVALECSFIDQAPIAGRWVIGAAAPSGHRISVVSETNTQLRTGDQLRVYAPAEPDTLFDAENHADNEKVQ